MDKTGGRVCYHGYQSFAEGEVDAETAHEIGVKLAERLWGNEYEVVVATHCNTNHYHNHFVLNPVSLVDGHKFFKIRKDHRLCDSIEERSRYMEEELQKLSEEQMRAEGKEEKPNEQLFRGRSGTGRPYESGRY